MKRARQPGGLHGPWWLASFAVCLALIGVVTVLSAANRDSSFRVTRSALASAPPGTYAIAVSGESGEDIVFAYRADDPADVREVARVPHLPGYTTRGAVDAAGRYAALVVAEGGTQARPLASLVIVDLATGETTRLAAGIDVLQTPLFAPAGAAVFVTRSVSTGTPATDVEIVRVSVPLGDGEVAFTVRGVLGAYPAGFDASGALLTVVIDGRGSTLLSDGVEVTQLSPSITRDWRVSPDGKQIAFIETRTAGGVSYHARLVDTGAGSARATAQQADDGQQLGVAWRPGVNAPTVGRDPSSRPGALGAAQVAGGFDVPLAYSADGRYLAVEAWDGDSFQAPGRSSFDIVSSGGRRELVNAARFLGWVTR